MGMCHACRIPVDKPKEKRPLGDPEVYETITLKKHLKEYDGMACTKILCLGKERNGGLLETQQ
jgi:hypothetical protein